MEKEKQKIEKIINSFYEEQGALFDKPLIGYSCGNDSLYSFYKKDIGDFYWTPEEAFLQKYPGEEISGGQLTVISIVLPQTEKTKNTQRKEKSFPSQNWVDSRLYFNELNSNMARYVSREFKKLGWKAVIPSELEQWKNYKTKKHIYASSWSERHAAYASGMGTFGLCDGLITEKGKAHRCTSIIVDIKLKPTERKYKSHTEYCLFYSQQGCGRCIERCPAGAISANGHDKLRCRKYQRETAGIHTRQVYNRPSDSCGLCQTGVPCESKIPVRQ